MRYFCTYFDQRFLARGLAMCESLRRNCPQFKLWVLCLDAQTHKILKALDVPNLEPLRMEEFEQGDVLLTESKKNRSLLEYYFTCTPSLPLFILKKHSDVDLITYLDSDLFFFSDIEPLFDEIKDKSIAIIAHRFSERFREWEWNGIYNVSWVTFRRDQNGLSALQWWRERCIEWCYDRIENNRFADQKYLDDWPARFQNVVVLEHKGANLAPWNAGNYELTLHDGAVWVDSQPLIFFHFHAFKRLVGWIHDTQLAKYDVVPSKLLVRQIFAPYAREVFSQSTRLGVSASTPFGSARKKPGDLLRAVPRLLKRQYMVIINGHIL